MRPNLSRNDRRMRRRCDLELAAMVRQVWIEPFDNLEQSVCGNVALGRRAFEDEFIPRVHGFQVSQ